MEIEDEMVQANDGYVVGGRKKNRKIQPTQKFDDEHEPDEFVFDPKTDFNSFVYRKEEQGSCSKLAGSWVLMALCAMLSFASANTLINEISPLGIDAIDYYNTGALIFCSIYLMRLKFKAKKVFGERTDRESLGMLDISVTEYRNLQCPRD